METSREQYVDRDEWPLPDSTAATGIIITTVSFLFFQITAFIVDRYLKTSSFLNNPKLHWRWKNVFISFTHAAIVSVCCLTSFYLTPKLTADMISTHTPLSHGTVALSAGYFLHDIVDMVVYDWSRKSLELLIHHVVILIAFSFPVLTYKSVGYMLVALLVEVNSIFLHFRQLLRIHKVDKKSSLYRLTSLLNLGTFIIFRIAALCWMTRWIVINKTQVPFFFYVLANIGLTTTTVMNIVLFYRCLKSDFICHANTSTTNVKLE
ncbi:TLC domain-containing protein 2-like [Octopus vulgaris]|uniref:TLC domain-containing protein 2-like n=2 Tax=Octopus TaxID=6643 RepID=A0AA36FJ62_OCTVU|nr:TLC domain-containing protein 2 [Octopus sinensis]CAI9740810.1 TLC domain-containing protein 2-like [Octopus vulgaris]